MDGYNSIAYLNSIASDCKNIGSTPYTIELTRKRKPYEPEPEVITTSEKTEEFKTFSVVKFLESNPQDYCQNISNFSLEQLQYLVAEIDKQLSMVDKRRRKPYLKTMDALFVTLVYYSLYISQKKLATFFDLEQSTFSKIVKKATNIYFPIFIELFIPKTPPIPRLKFKFFPHAVGAVDSSTIPWTWPTEKELLTGSWDTKNSINGAKMQVLVNPDGICIHISAARHPIQ